MRMRLLAVRLICLLTALAVGAGPLGCRNPAVSQLPPSDLAPPGTPVPQLAKGDVYAGEPELSPETVIQPGDRLDILIRRGSGEESATALVRKTGLANVSFVEVEVIGLTAAQAAAKIQLAVEPFMHNPYVQVRIKRENPKVKRIFVLGDVSKPGMYPMTRGMTVMEAVLAAESYHETALLDEVRVIRGDLAQPDIHTADIARLLTYGDASRNLELQENDVVYVPREKLGDAAAAANKLAPIFGAVLAPLQIGTFGLILSGR